MGISTTRTSAGLCVGALLAAAAVATAADEPVRKGDQLIYPEGAEIPRDMTGAEQRFVRENPITALDRGTAPPQGEIHCFAEYEPMEGILMAYEGSGSWLDILDEMAANITTTGDANIYVMVDSVSEGNSAVSFMTSAGADSSRIFPIVASTDTIWIRDYGPRYISVGDVRAIVDHTYNRPRPNDDNQPGVFANYKGHAKYDIPLVHGGGNYHLDASADRWSYTSELISNENPGLTDAQIIQYWRDFQNLETTITDAFPTWVDSTQHIDMWMQIVGDRKVMISDWPNDPGSTQDQICETWTTFLENRGYTVYRIPARSVSGTHYTYTNMVICNNLALIPQYSNSQVAGYNAQAISTYESALPGYTVVGVPCENIVWASGVMHCIVMHVPANPNGENPGVYLGSLRGGETVPGGSSVEINWLSDDDEGVDSIDIELSRDGGSTWETIVNGTADDGSYTWSTPDVYIPQARIRVTAEDADGNTGSDESDSNFLVDGSAVPGDLTGDGVVNADDLFQMLGAWGSCPGCPEDLTGDGVVNADDLFELLGNWG